MLMRFSTVTALLSDLRPSDEITEATLVTKHGRTIELGAKQLENFNSAIRGDVEVLAPVEDLDVPEQLVTPEDAAKLLGVTRQTIYAWQKNGRMGRRQREGSRAHLVPLEDVVAMQEQRRANEDFKAWLASKPPVTDSEVALATQRFSGLATRMREAE